MKKITKNIFYTILLILTITYIIYRIFFTIPTKLGLLSLIAAIIVLLIEIWEAFDFFIYYLNILLVDRKSPKTPKIEITESPDIDILIATYNEPEKLLEKTAKACLSLNYPDKNKIHIYLCDDGNRPNIKKLADDLHINYISRLVNKNAKAGNYNHALQKLTSPFVATFDADMAPTPDFLTKTLPYFFTNEKIGFIQMPQSFINPDIYQYRLGLGNNIPFEQDYFYHSLQISKNETNSAVYCGTNTLFSRQALNDAGGFATGTLSEDIATGMLIESKGYKCLAINDIESYGQSVNDIDGFIKQRSRWARGCVQMFKKYKILTIKGLSFRQKLEYLSCVSYWFFGVRRLVYLLTPLLFSIFGIIIINCDLKVFLSLWLPSYILKRFVLDRVENHKRSSTWNKIYETILTPVLYSEVLKELIGFSKTKFEVTPKTLGEKKNKMTKPNKKLFFSHLILFTINIIGLIMCINKVQSNIDNAYLYLLSIVWTISNTFYLTIALIFDLKTNPKKHNEFTPNKIMTYSRKAIFKLFLGTNKQQKEIKNN